MIPVFSPDEEKHDLTDEDKYECVVRWLNRLWYGVLNADYMPDGSYRCTDLETPCIMEECPAGKYGARTFYECQPTENFKILEKHTGKDTVVDFCLNKKFL